WNKKHLSLDNFRVYDFHGNFKNRTSVVKTFHESIFFEERPIVYTNSPLKSVELSSNLEYDEKVYDENISKFVEETFLTEGYDPREHWNATAFDLGKGSSEGKFTLTN